MTLYGFLFYVIAAATVAATVVAVTRRNMVHAVVYLIFSYFGTAMLFYLFGAPFLAILEVIIYAGAIMVLFLFVVMMIKVEAREELLFPIGQWLPAAVLGLVYLAAGVTMIFKTPGTEAPLGLLMASPIDFALYIFQHHWFLIELISLLLLVALVAALHMGMGRESKQIEEEI